MDQRCVRCVLPVGGQVIQGKDRFIEALREKNNDPVLELVILSNQSWCAGSLAWEIQDHILEMIP